MRMYTIFILKANPERSIQWEISFSAVLKTIRIRTKDQKNLNKTIFLYNSKHIYG